MNNTMPKKELTISSELAFRFLMMAFWTNNTVLIFARAFFSRLPIIGSLSPYLLPVLFIVLIGMSLPYMAEKIKGKDLLFYFGIVALVALSLVFFRDNAAYISVELWRILGLSVPIYFLGVCYDSEKEKKDLFWASLVSVVLIYLYYSGEVQANTAMEDNMDAAYRVLPSIMYLIYYAMTTKGVFNWVLAVAAVFMVFIFGSRGPVLVIVVFLAFGGFISVAKSEKWWLKILYVLICGFLIYFFASGEQVMTLAENLSETFRKIGFSTRIFDYFIEGEIAYDSGRGKILDTISEAIRQNPIVGYGFMGDRPLLSSNSYTHNLLYEVVCHYGTIVGPIVLAFMFGVPICAILKAKDRDTVLLLLMFACMVFVRLMLSSSYVYEANLYFLFGLSANVLRRNKQQN